MQGLLLNVEDIILSWIFFMLFIDFKAEELRSIPALPIVVWAVFSIQMPTQMSIHYLYHGILVLVRYGNIYALVR